MSTDFMAMNVHATGHDYVPYHQHSNDTAWPGDDVWQQAVFNPSIPLPIPNTSTNTIEAQYTPTALPHDHWAQIYTEYVMSSPQNFPMSMPRMQRERELLYQALLVNHDISSQESSPSPDLRLLTPTLENRDLEQLPDNYGVSVESTPFGEVLETGLGSSSDAALQDWLLAAMSDHAYMDMGKPFPSCSSSFSSSFSSSPSFEHNVQWMADRGTYF